MPKDKRPTYEVIDREERADLYQMLSDLIDDCHEELREARIALFWRNGWKADEDGRVTLGASQIPGKTDRLLHGYDLRILLNREVWESVEFSEAQKRALLDHYLENFAPALDDNSDQRLGPDGLLQWRKRKPTIAEHQSVVRRNGCWHGAIEAFVLEAQAGPTLFDSERGHARALADAVEDLRPKAGSGIENITFSSGGKSATLKAN